MHKVTTLSRHRIGKHKSSKSCLYINKLADVDIKVLTELVKASVTDIKRNATETPIEHSRKALAWRVEAEG